MAEKTNETATSEKKETAKKSSSKTTGRSSASKSSASKSTQSKSGSKSTGSRSAASRNSSARSNSGRGGNRNSSGGNRGRGANSTANKVYAQSPIAIVCYVLAALMVLYACYTAGNTVKQINEYYGSYGMTASGKDYITYVAQAILEPLINAFTFFMAGYILTAVRKLDPKNYVSAKPAKKPESKNDDKTVEFSKQAEKAEKTEAKVAKAADDKMKAASETEKKAETATKTTKEEFEESLEAELKKEEEKA